MTGRAPSWKVANSDVVFEDFTDKDGKIGDLRMSRGGVLWWPRSARTAKADLTWEQFRQLIES